MSYPGAPGGNFPGYPGAPGAYPGAYPAYPGAGGPPTLGGAPQQAAPTGPANARPNFLPEPYKEIKRDLYIPDNEWKTVGEDAASKEPEQSLASFMSLGQTFDWYRADKPKKPEPVQVYLSPKYSYFIVRRIDDKEIKANVWLRDIEELRVGGASSVFDAEFPNGNNPRANRSVTLIWPKTTMDLVLIDSDPRSFERFIGGLKYFCRKLNAMPSLDANLARVWESLKKDQLTEKEVVPLLEGLNIKTDSKDVKKRLATVDANNDRNLDFVEFKQLVLSMLERPEVRELFQRFSSDKRVLRPEELLAFLQQEQQETNTTLDWVQKVVAEFAGPGAAGLSLQQFHDYITSPLNAVTHHGCRLSPAQRDHKEYQDMTLPLTHYWIASSHNTYLEGDQLAGRSSSDQYVRVLDSGCRCVELDCWDSDSGDPIIFHGHTLTSKIKFRDAVTAIRNNAFKYSPYPVILSLEMHCKAAGQERIAAILKELLKDTLAMPPPPGQPLPSPAALKNKIIIKGKGEGEDAVDSLVQLTMLRSSKFSGFDKLSGLTPLNMFSWSEEVLSKYDADAVVRLTSKHLIRSYPKGTSIASGNYTPLPWWCSGAQIVALNYQTPGKFMALNSGRFIDNGGCGYVLKPQVLLNPPSGVFKHDNSVLAPIASSAIRRLAVTVIDARHLPKSAKGTKGKSDIVDPYVVVSVQGAKIDSSEQETKVVDDNGFNPAWGVTKTFQVVASEVAMLGFRVMDKDTLGSDGQLAHFYCPLETIRPGYRTVPLFDEAYRPLPGSNLFVKIAISA